MIPTSRRLVLLTLLLISHESLIRDCVPQPSITTASCSFSDEDLKAIIRFQKLQGLTDDEIRKKLGFVFDQQPPRELTISRILREMMEENTMENTAACDNIRRVAAASSSKSSSGEGEGNPLPQVVVVDQLSSFNPVQAISSAERYLIIPGRRQRPFGTRVRVMVRNKVREFKIITVPRMSTYEALKQAEKKIQYQHPELANQKVILSERRLVETKDGIKECTSIVRVGVVEEDENNYWLIRISYSPGTQVVYEGRCVPNEKEVHVRPATTIDLIYSPVETSSLSASSSESPL